MHLIKVYVPINFDVTSIEAMTSELYSYPLHVRPYMTKQTENAKQWKLLFIKIHQGELPMPNYRHKQKYKSEEHIEL